MNVSFTGKATGLLNIHAKTLEGIIQSEIYAMIDSLFYDDATTDRSREYYINSSYVSISNANNEYTASFTGTSTSPYVDVRGLTDALLGKTVTVSVDVELGTLEARLRAYHGSSAFISSRFVTGSQTLKLENVELPSTSTGLFFRMDSRNIVSGDSIKFKNWKIYFV